jgi:hypothetical protein
LDILENEMEDTEKVKNDFEAVGYEKNGRTKR